MIKCIASRETVDVDHRAGQWSDFSGSIEKGETLKNNNSSSFEETGGLFGNMEY